MRWAVSLLLDGTVATCTCRSTDLIVWLEALRPGHAKKLLTLPYIPGPVRDKTMIFLVLVAIQLLESPNNKVIDVSDLFPWKRHGTGKNMWGSILSCSSKGL